MIHKIEALKGKETKLKEEVESLSSKIENILTGDKTINDSETKKTGEIVQTYLAKSQELKNTRSELSELHKKAVIKFCKKIFEYSSNPLLEVTRLLEDTSITEAGEIRHKLCKSDSKIIFNRYTKNICHTIEYTQADSALNRSEKEEQRKLFNTICEELYEIMECLEEARAKLKD